MSTLATHDLPTRPTLQQLKSQVRKGGTKNTTDPFWLSRWVYRPISIYLTWLAIRLHLRANTVTLLSAFALFAAALCMGVSKPLAWVIGGLLVNLYFVLDHVDGELGRYEQTVLHQSAGMSGLFYDTAVHAGEYALYIALAMRLYTTYGQPWWLLLLTLLMLFPGSIQPWQRYCEAVVAYARGHTNADQATFPAAMAHISSLAQTGTRISDTGTSRVRRMIGFALQTVGFPGYFLTLLVCALLDYMQVPQIMLAGTPISYLLIWFVIQIGRAHV